MMVLKITSIHSRQQRDIAEKEAKLLSRLSHPSIIKTFDACYRSNYVEARGLKAELVGNQAGAGGAAARPQHLILMEYCEGGHALDVCNRMAQAGRRFDLSSLIIAFGQICNAVSYLHAQRPPIVHRDLKPVNFLVKNGAYKLCDFGSAVFGHIELKTPRARQEAEEVIQKTTTQMFRAPEMVDLYMAKKLTQSTDVWALGCCFFSLAFLQNCFEEGSNLAILSRNYKIPEDNPYGEGLVELIDRMLTVDHKARADMTEVILCLSAIYSGRPLPPRKKTTKSKKPEANPTEGGDRVGTFRTDGQGIRTTVIEQKRATEAKKLNPNSAAARRRRAAHGADSPSEQPGVTFQQGLPTSSTSTAKDYGDSSFSELMFYKNDNADPPNAAPGNDDGFGFGDKNFTLSSSRSEEKRASESTDAFGFTTDNKGFNTNDANAFNAFDYGGWGAQDTSGGDGFDNQDLVFQSFDMPQSKSHGNGNVDNRSGLR
eukprot:CAMPEP_0118705316 /NCGR_PEP_ID=MMETSP0800-20121206/19801_1 /TAXON_ID=210618 ORGANISM="Striatella unipunctata, Strain CCMP2910" /NCGR_SAMPLE_ID=MMETSP0800 /ASSEMBLY_ACC=CAM_ASM_000638 /LENGTH=484 /DNA_ID=CAMNT_0006607459 /DNA_START=316 /DNA_END=1770 /DNA_ORIENTATION=-